MNAKGETASNTTEKLPCGQLPSPLTTPDVKAKNMSYAPIYAGNFLTLYAARNACWYERTFINDMKGKYTIL